MKLTAHLHPVPRLRMSWVIPQLPPYAFMARTGKNFTFCLTVVRARTKFVGSKLYTLLPNKMRVFYLIINDMAYLLSAIGLTPGGSTHLHTSNT